MVSRFGIINQSIGHLITHSTMGSSSKKKKEKQKDFQVWSPAHGFVRQVAE